VFLQTKQTEQLYVLGLPTYLNISVMNVQMTVQMEFL